jgi:hypothetical protein
MGSAWQRKTAHFIDRKKKKRRAEAGAVLSLSTAYLQ